MPATVYINTGFVKRRLGLLTGGVSILRGWGQIVEIFVGGGGVFKWGDGMCGTVCTGAAVRQV